MSRLALFDKGGCVSPQPPTVDSKNRPPWAAPRGPGAARFGVLAAYPLAGERYCLNKQACEPVSCVLAPTIRLAVNAW